MRRTKCQANNKLALARAVMSFQSSISNQLKVFPAARRRRHGCNDCHNKDCSPFSACAGLSALGGWLCVCVCVDRHNIIIKRVPRWRAYNDVVMCVLLTLSHQESCEQRAYVYVGPTGMGAAANATTTFDWIYYYVWLIIICAYTLSQTHTHTHERGFKHVEHCAWPNSKRQSIQYLWI